MHRFKRIALGTGILIFMTSATAIAQGKGGGHKSQGGGAPKAAQTTKSTQSPKVQPAKAQAPVKAGGSTKTASQGKSTKPVAATQSAKNTKVTTTRQGPKSWAHRDRVGKKDDEVHDCVGQRERVDVDRDNADHQRQHAARGVDARAAEAPEEYEPCEQGAVAPAGGNGSR